MPFTDDEVLSPPARRPEDFGWSQWQGASTRPPHLAAILPYDGATDAYREIAFHGGIPNDQFLRATVVHPMLDEFWESKRPDLAAIGIPTYVVASWTDHAIHTRGSLEGFRHPTSSTAGRGSGSRCATRTTPVPGGTRTSGLSPERRTPRCTSTQRQVPRCPSRSEKSRRSPTTPTPGT